MNFQYYLCLLVLNQDKSFFIMEEDHESGIYRQFSSERRLENGCYFKGCAVDYLAAKVNQAVVDRSYIKKYKINEVILLKISI
ncbi:hypothetical protein [Peribacillus sp. NPDC097895]|uniref:hypothetical protein n=1 Tax=Peribacillus sp. NPDC097895 TaxID=3390619 RepID=UPI003CFDD0B8